MRRDSVPPTTGQRAAEIVARTVGSWAFIIIQSGFLTAWVILNVIGVIRHWDPYPFILMNLFLSLQAAYTAPMILMSQNRQAEKDRMMLYEDWVTDHETSRIVKQLTADIQNHLVQQDTRIDMMLRQVQRLSEHRQSRGDG